MHTSRLFFFFFFASAEPDGQAFIVSASWLALV